MRKIFGLQFSGVLLIICAGAVFWRLNQADTRIPEQPSVVEEKTESLGQQGVVQQYSEVSFAHLVERSYDAPALTWGGVIERTTAYIKYSARYQSDDLTIGGVLYIPNEAAPTEGYPVVITNHGHIDTSIYTTGRGLKREQIYFAERGYVVFHPDYRNHAESSKTEEDPIQDRLGYIIDILHAVESLKNTDLKVNRENITLLGHSMGGGATLAAALVRPDISSRIVLYAPVTVNYLDSYNRWQKKDQKQAEFIATKYGAPEQNQIFWGGLNGEPYYDRLNIPVQIYHGTQDQDVPYEWATKMRDDLQEKNKQVELITYEGEGHEFSFAWETFMQSVEQFTKR